ncbi:cytochrome C biogenesis protein [Phycicoccus sp. CSK15P-2]|uniref:cytochrome c biogenesis protein CcdA n=1 Tax=Phycicoccus sp. CSK15P-2 TaxID=2807627 RepID=UPI00194F45C1|nr:cytochrome c biogenesis protein CcdA [Phycicoccus sp. CSK15P-2]MBM6403005.1 cytochrome C biogenesis protein [Phycicoccus sp. CSK15P-2]
MLVALAGALLAGALTTLAPCALSLLPVIVGGSLAGTPGRAATRRALLVAGSLGASVFVFTLALKATTALIGIPPSVWQWVSGGLLVVLGLTQAVPELWDRVSVATGLSSGSARGLSAAHRRGGTLGAVLTGAALGPVFTSCSPLYGYVVVTVLPAEPARGLALLTSYVVGLVAVLLAVAVGGQRAVGRMRWAADPHSPFRRALGVLFVVVGVLVATGLMLELEAWVLEHSPVAPWEVGSEIGR